MITTIPHYTPGVSSQYANGVIAMCTLGTGTILVLEDSYVNMLICGDLVTLQIDEDTHPDELERQAAEHIERLRSYELDDLERATLREFLNEAY